MPQSQQDSCRIGERYPPAGFVGQSGEPYSIGTEHIPLLAILRGVNTLAERITVDPEQCGGRPCIRGMRIRVSDVLDLFAAGLTSEQILEEMPDLQPEDLQASLFHQPNAALSPKEVDALVASFRKQAIAFRDTVPRPDPPLESPCNF